MEYSNAHVLSPDNRRAEWWEAEPPDLENEHRQTGRIRCCGYCGSMHPTDVAAAIRVGARGELADMKYGWPHKIYFHGVPNPHAGMLESRGSANHPYADYVQVSEKRWQAPGKPADATIMWKFYTVHLIDATSEEKALIEAHLGIRFEFAANGQISYSRV